MLSPFADEKTPLLPKVSVVKKSDETAITVRDEDSLPLPAITSSTIPKSQPHRKKITLERFLEWVNPTLKLDTRYLTNEYSAQFLKFQDVLTLRATCRTFRDSIDESRIQIDQFKFPISVLTNLKPEAGLAISLPNYDSSVQKLRQAVLQAMLIEAAVGITICLISVAAFVYLIPFITRLSNGWNFANSLASVLECLPTVSIPNSPYTSGGAYLCLSSSSSAILKSFNETAACQSLPDWPYSKIASALTEEPSGLKHFCAYPNFIEYIGPYCLAEPALAAVAIGSICLMSCSTSDKRYALSSSNTFFLKDCRTGWLTEPLAAVKKEVTTFTARRNGNRFAFFKELVESQPPTGAGAASGSCAGGTGGGAAAAAI